MPSQHCLHATNTLTQRKLIAAAFLAWIHHTAFAVELNTTLPGNRTVILDKKITVDLPAQNLDAVLKQFSKQSNMDIAYDTETARKTRSAEVKGTFSRREILQKLLQGSGLSVSFDGDAATITPTPAKENTSIQLDSVEVRAKRFYEVGPLPGLGLTKEEIPGNVQSISAKEIKEAHSLSLTDLMNRKLQSVTVNDYQGNPFQMDVQYRGFTAGPQIGTPQGLSVFIDGIRVNEPFGDVVNWDMIPMNALAGVDVFPGSNPIFGLNTLGGAFSMKTKDGFNNAGVDADILTGSFGRKQLQVEGGWNNGTIGLFGAGNFFLEDGWRKNSPSKVNQFFGKASYRGDKLDLNLSTLLVGNDLVGNGLLPSEMYAQDPTSVFSSPDKTKNRLQQFQLSGSYFVNDSFTITGQLYRRNSKRHQKGGDVFTDWDSNAYARRLPNSGEQYTCLFNSTNQYGIPDYYVFTTTNLGDAQTAFDTYFNSSFVQNYINTGTVDTNLLPADSFNKTLSADFVSYLKSQIATDKNYVTFDLNRDSKPAIIPPTTDYSFGEVAYNADVFTGNGGYAFIPANSVDPFTGLANYFYTQENGVISKHFVLFVGPSNQSNCSATQNQFPLVDGGKNAYAYYYPGTTTLATVDGSYTGTPGVIYETDPVTGKKYYYPTAVITDNQIDQMIDGASLQLNWNLEHHKLMVGMSIDSASADYTNKQWLGLLDNQRAAYLSPDTIHPQFAGATIPLMNNDFSGTNTTQSVYFSETWSPVSDWHFNASARYNATQVKNKVATRYGAFVYGLDNFLSYPDSYDICNNGVCNTALNYKLPNLSSVLDPAETEKFSYYSLNPALGFTWQARETLNVFANVAQGARVPSVIELGCALDKRPSGQTVTDGNGNVYDIPVSLAQNRQCSLPTTLSGDPYLPQIKATSYDIGMRGSWGEHAQWNIGAYQTDLKDDIYFVAVGNGQGFFDSIGKTRRRGFEAGLSGKKDKLGFSVNYSLTDATFQDSFLMFSRDNSSAIMLDTLGEGVIQVNKGNRMPGVPLHNLNATLSYDITNQWSMGLTAVAHSDSFVRGNENNEHEQGVVRSFTAIRYVDDGTGTGTTIPEAYTKTLPATTNPGKVAGYATFNFQTSYKFNKEWTATLLINNLFDKEYFTAGRLGRNPFSPSINGAIGPDGYNHNSGDWLSTNFIAPGAPRGIWFSLNWHFVPD